ncbi:MAG: DUF3754 domain-containing protein, partial [Planctomycetes bacterium]|nr:DUF3754 domain-containing protein [Planctomycetota bacterium]
MSASEARAAVAASPGGAGGAREHFIPISKADVVRLAAEHARFAGDDAARFRDLARLVEAIFHFKFHEALEDLKASYAPFNPDRDTREMAPPTPEERAQCEARLMERLGAVFAGANYVALGEEQIQQALDRDSGWGVALAVDMTEFEQRMLFVRGETVGTKYKKSLATLFRERPYQVPVYQRLAVLVKFRESEAERRERRKKGDPRHIYLKLFKDVPKDDLEMLFPNVAVRMKGIDKVKISMPMLLGLITVGWKSAGVILAAIGIQKAAEKGSETGQVGWYAVGLVLAAVIGYLVKSIRGYFAARTKYRATLAESLYFLNLDNNAGVFQHLVDQAEEQEVKEAVLGWCMLQGEPAGLTPAEVDRRAEALLSERAGVECDFEVDDAIRKLEALNVVRRDGDRLVARSLPEALEMLDYQWDNYFDFNRAGAVPGGGPPGDDPSG